MREGSEGELEREVRPGRRGEERLSVGPLPTISSEHGVGWEKK